MHDDYEPKHLAKMTRGWLFPYLVDGDELFGTKRWRYWGDVLLDLNIPGGPIPQVDFLDQGDRETIKHISDMLDYAARIGGVRHSDAFESFVAWMLHGFGDVAFKECETPDQIPYLRVPVPVLDFWYEKFELGRLQMHPCDYMAHFAQGGENKGYNPYKGFGFFATPMSLCKMMAMMNFGGEDVETAKRASVCDPCCGTGSLLLAASNYSLNLYGVDISQAMVRCCRLNGWLYAPWMVFWPNFEWLGWTRERIKGELFGKGAPRMAVDEAAEVMAPVEQNVMCGELEETETGQYVMPLF